MRARELGPSRCRSRIGSRSSSWTAGEPPATLLEIYISREGRYVGANDAALTLLQYTRDELTDLPLGALSGNDPAAAREVWSRQMSGEIAFPTSRLGTFITKAGRGVAAIFGGVAPDGPDGSYVSRASTLCPAETASHESPVPVILAQWRAAERSLAGLDEEDPRRAELSAEVERLRTIYQIESRLRRG